MPIYEFQCAQCGAIHEVVQKFSDEPLKTCSHCGGEVSKLVSLSSFALKGGGWYTTDYKRAPAAPASTNEAAPAPGTAKETAEKPAEKPAEAKKESAKSEASAPAAPAAASKGTPSSAPSGGSAAKGSGS